MNRSLHCQGRVQTDGSQTQTIIIDTIGFRAATVQSTVLSKKKENNGAKATLCEDGSSEQSRDTAVSLASNTCKHNHVLLLHLPLASYLCFTVCGPFYNPCFKPPSSMPYAVPCHLSLFLNVLPYLPACSPSPCLRCGLHLHCYAAVTNKRLCHEANN